MSFRRRHHIVFVWSHALAGWAVFVALGFGLGIPEWNPLLCNVGILLGGLLGVKRL